MSEPRFTTPNKPSRSRKRPVKVEEAAPPSEAAPRPTSRTRSAPARQTIAISVSALDREGMIRTAAYFSAQRRHFVSGHELEDWLAAEAEIDTLLLAGGLSA